jgi:ureidoacrylate peracid hydrolase
VVVDVQNDFCHPDGAVAKMGNDVGALAAMMPALHRLVESARRWRIPRIFVRTELSEWFDDPAWRMRGRTGSSFDPERVPVVRAGTWGAQLYQLEPQEDELVLTKYRYSAFTYTPLELALRSQGCRTVLLAGTATHQCVEATAREAIGKGFFPVLVRDAAASRSPQMHDAAVDDFGAHLGAVLTVAQVEGAWLSRYSRSEGGAVAVS